MKRIRLLGPGLLALMLAACATSRLAQAPALPQPPQRLVQYGYSFMPPAEKGWHVLGRNGRQIVLGRPGDSRDETVMIVAGDVTAPRFKDAHAFERYVREQMTRDGDADGRFSKQKFEFTPLTHDGAQCLRAHMSSIDHRAKRRSGGKGDLVLEILQLSCRHPDDAGTVTYLGYSRRYEPGKRDPALMDKGMQVLDSLRFSPF